MMAAIIYSLVLMVKVCADSQPNNESDLFAVRNFVSFRQKMKTFGD